jgi:hypothetical protein
MYSPLLARFLSADSLVQAPADPQTLNRYAYTRNNPLKYVDPSGHCFLFAGLDTLACLGAWMMVAGGLGLAGVASYQLMPDQIKADAGRAIDALVTDLTRGPEAIHNTAGAGPQINANPALGYPLGPAQGAGTGGGYPLAGESGALRLTTPLQGSATVQLGGPLMAVKPWEVGEYAKLRNKSDPNDCIEIHHCPQKHPAKQVIPGYDEDTAPAIAVPVDKHGGPGGLNSMNITGSYGGTPRQLVNEGLSNLRMVGAPESAIRKLQKLINKKYGPHIKAE